MIRVDFGDNLHHNDGIHLDIVVVCCVVWQHCWWYILKLPMCWGYVLTVCLGSRFISLVISKIKGVGYREWDYELPLIFLATIVPTMDDLWSFKEIHTQIAHQIDVWDQGNFAELVDDAIMSV